jgi:integrase
MPDYTWQEAVMVWLDEKPERKENKNMLYGLKWLDGYLRDRLIRNIDKPLIDFIKQEKKNTGVKNRTINASTQQIKTILKCAVEHGMLVKIPTVKMLSEPKRRIRFLSEFEESRLLSELPDHLIPIVKFALSTGLRMSNITGLKWENVDLINKMATVYSDEFKTGITVGVPLNSDALGVLQKQRGKHSTYVFTYNRRRIKNAGAKAWRNATKRAGLVDFHFHDLRHTWASRHIMGGTSLYELMELGGWTKADTVRKYAHLTIGHLHAIANNSTSDTKLTQRVL